MVCLFTPQLLLVLTASTHEGLSRPGWLVLHRDGLLALRWLPILVLTRSDVAQLRRLIKTTALPLTQAANPKDQCSSIVQCTLALQYVIN